MFKMNIAIVGMGISGLLTTLHLLSNKHINTMVIFEKRYVSYIPRKHCTGIISRETLARIPYADKFIENSYRYVEISTHGGLNLCLVFDKDSIYKIDRVAHEKMLIDFVESKCVKINYGEHIVGIENLGDRYRILGEKPSNELFDAVVISEGYPPRLSKAVGLKAIYKPLKSLQQSVYLNKKLRYEQVKTLYTYLGVNREGFAWFVPKDDRKAVVGVAVKDSPDLYLRFTKKLFEKRLNVEVDRVEDTYGGTVLRGYPKKLVIGRILGIGDALAMVKSLSGGGLYAISITSKIYGENIHNPQFIQKKITSLIRELKQHFLLYRACERILPSIEHLPKKRSIIVEVYKSYLYDNHVKMFIEFIKTPGVLAKILVQLIH